jgi:hypothetical protein
VSHEKRQFTEEHEGTPGPDRMKQKNAITFLTSVSVLGFRMDGFANSNSGKRFFLYMFSEREVLL